MFGFKKFAVSLSLALSGIVISDLALAKHNRPDLFVVTEHLPPFQIITENYGIGGFATEFIQEIMSRTTLTSQLNAYSWTRSYNLAQQRENTCIYSMARLPSRIKQFQWVGPITATNTVVFGVNAPDAPQLKKLEDAKNHTIAVIKDDVTHLALLERGFVNDKNLYVVDSTHSLFRLLVARPDIDFILADDITMSYRAKLAGVDAQQIKRVFEIENFPLNFYFACSLNTDKQIVETLRNAMEEVRNDGTYDKIVAKWRKESPWLTTLNY